LQDVGSRHGRREGTPFRNGSNRPEHGGVNERRTKHDGCVMKRNVLTIIVEPRTLLREGLASLLDESNFTVVASVATLEQVPRTAAGRVGLFIVGVAIGAPDDFQLLEGLLLTKQDCKIVAVADGNDQPTRIDIPQILRSGADAYILNIQSRDVLLKSLELAFLGQKLVVVGEKCRPVELLQSSKSSERSDENPLRNGGNGGISSNGSNGSNGSIGSHGARPALSGRELEILNCLASGDSNKIIARTCRIAESTVKLHLKSILRKIQVQNRTQAAIWALQNNPPGMRAPRPVSSPALAPHGFPDEFE
jgi:two-component system, NarL family, nitrate/nitrite response regulator NarL